MLSRHIRKVPGDDTWNILGVVDGKVYRTSTSKLIAVQPEATLIKRSPSYAILIIRRLYRRFSGDFYVLSQWWEITYEKRKKKETLVEYVIEPYTLDQAMSFYMYNKSLVPYEDVLLV